MDPPLCPSVPLVNVQIGAADGRDLDLHQNFRASELRNLNLADLGAGGGTRFQNCLHNIWHSAHGTKLKILHPEHRCVLEVGRKKLELRSDESRH